LNSAIEYVFPSWQASPRIKISKVFDLLEMSMSIYVGNLPFAASQEDVSNVFAEYGTVKSVQLPTDRETDRMRGFGFVEMETDAEEIAAIEALNGAEWMSRELKVNKARPHTDRGSFDGSRGRNDNRSFSRNSQSY
jgi:RNA recognition motif-containing protein